MAAAPVLLELPIVAGAHLGDVFTTTVTKDSTLRDVAAQLRAMVGGNPSEYRFFLNGHGIVRYAPEVAGRSLGSYLAHCRPLPVALGRSQVDKPGPEGEVIRELFAKTLTGKTIRFASVLGCDNIIFDLKTHIMDHEGIPVDQQRLICAGRQLEDCRSLRSYNVGHKAVLHLVLRLRGGGEVVNFADVTRDGALRKMEWSSGAPMWRRVGKGLVLKGRCKNRACVAHNGHVYCTLGFTVFDLMTDSHRVVCPACETQFKPKCPGFNNCYWRWEAIKADASNTLLTKTWTKAGDCYTTFDEAKSGHAAFVHLQLEVRPLEKGIYRPDGKGDSTGVLQSGAADNDDARRTAVVSDDCAVCFCSLNPSDPRICVLSCGHTFHGSCASAWKKAQCERAGGRRLSATCPLCRTEY
jgi:hypothetical protein